MTALTAGVIGIGLAAPRLPGPGEHRPRWLILFAVAMLAQWTATSVFAAVWLWRAGADRPTAPRYRMRMLALGCAGFNILVLLSVLRPQSNPQQANHVIQVLDLVVASIFYIGLAPPHILIERWREPERAATRAAFSDLVSAVTAHEVGVKLLPHVVAYVGAQGAALYDRNDGVIASYGTIPGDLPDGDGRSVPEDDVLRFSLRDGGCLVVYSNTYSPLFGADQVSILQSFADWADLALGRCALIARERQFISNAAHELRTPLASLTGFASLLATERHKMSEEEVEVSLRAMVRQGDRARRLVNNLLDMAQIERGAMHFASEIVELAGVVEESLESAPAPTGRQVEVHIPAGVRVRADPARLQQVIVNLVTNAYNYGGPDIMVDAKVDEVGRVVVAITDDGVGVASDLVPHLFEPFARDVSSNGSGSGLGLAICRQITNALGGSISYDSQRTSGARFVVTLPQAA